MQTTHSSLQDKPTSDDSLPGEGPRPHEDLTIAEHLETMCRHDEQRPGEQCFIVEHGESHWIDSSDLSRFIHEFGALHPSDYFSRHGTDWRHDLFNQA